MPYITPYSSIQQRQTEFMNLYNQGQLVLEVNAFPGDPIRLILSFQAEGGAFQSSIHTTGELGLDFARKIHAAVLAAEAAPTIRTRREA